MGTGNALQQESTERHTPAAPLFHATLMSGGPHSWSANMGPPSKLGLRQFWDTVTGGGSSVDALHD